VSETVYDLKCLMCSRDVGQVRHGHLLLSSPCSPAVLRSRGPTRCACGGSLYLEPNAEPGPLQIDWARVARESGALEESSA
jgi:hypothetical protein